MNCSRCNALLPEDALFCPNCGAAVQKPAADPLPESFQPYEPEDETGAVATLAEEVTGSVAPEAAADCAQQSADKAEPVRNLAADAAAGVKTAVKKMNPKVLKIGASVLAAVLVIALIASLFAGSGIPNHAIYIKDGELQYAEMPKGNKPVEITNALVDEDGVSDSELANAGAYLGAYVHITGDGKRLFYPDKINEEGFTLYCRQLSSMKKDPVKIDSDLTEYTVNEKGSIVTYVKDGKLYQHDLKEKTKIESDVSSYRVSDDGKTLVYLVWDDEDDAGTLYLKKGSKDAEKIASDVTRLYHADEDCKTVLYGKEDALYIKKGGKDAEKIASDVTNVWHVYEDGSFYYLSGEEEEITYWDLMNDDYEDKTDWSYESYKEMLQGNTVYGLSFSKLCYYDGKKSVTVSEAVTEGTDYAAQEAVLIYTGMTDAELPSFSLTKYISGEIDLLDEIEEYKEENASYFIAAGDKTEAMDWEDVRYACLTEDGKSVYLGCEYDAEENTVTVRQLTLNGAKVKKAQKLDEEVYAGYRFVTEEGFVYFKEVDGYEGELYISGKHVDDDVYTSKVRLNEQTGDLYYMVDWDSDSRMGTLKYWNGRKAVSVKDDVSFYTFTPEGETLFLYDYDDYMGELWIQNGKKTAKLEDDVCAILEYYSLGR